MIAAPILVLAFLALLCVSPLAIPLFPALLWCWWREKRAGRNLSFRLPFGNETDPEPDVAPVALPESDAEPQAGGRNDAL